MAKTEPRRIDRYPRYRLYSTVVKKVRESYGDDRTYKGPSDKAHTRDPQPVDSLFDYLRYIAALDITRDEFDPLDYAAIQLDVNLRMQIELEKLRSVIEQERQRADENMLRQSAKIAAAHKLASDIYATVKAAKPFAYAVVYLPARIVVSCLAEQDSASGEALQSLLDSHHPTMVLVAPTQDELNAPLADLYKQAITTLVADPSISYSRASVLAQHMYRLRPLYLDTLGFPLPSRAAAQP